MGRPKAVPMTTITLKKQSKMKLSASGLSEKGSDFP
jgi:hypothetical protein